MLRSEKFWELVDQFMAVIQAETDFPVLIYDTDGYIIRATEKSRIGDLHAGAEQIMRAMTAEYAVTAHEAAQNPLVREGYSCPIIVDGKIVAGFGITGRLEVARPLAKVAIKMIDSWIQRLGDQEQLECSEYKYRNIFDNSLHGIYQATMDGRFLTVNPAFAEILGYQSPDALLAAVTDIAHQLYVDPADRRISLEKIVQNGHLAGFVTQFKRRDGQIIDVSIHARVMHDPATDAPYIEGLLEDITARRKTEAAIRLSEEKYFKAFNSCPVWVVLSSVETGRYIEVNETFLRTMGYTRQEVLGRTALEIEAWDNPDDRLNIVNTIKAHGSIRNLELKRRTRSGKVLTMLFSADIIEVSGEACLLSVSQDISERKQMEEDLRLSKDNLRTTLHSIGDAVITTDTDGVVTRMNNMAAKLTGWPAGEAVGRKLPEVFHIVHGVTRNQELNPVDQVLASGKIVGLANHTILIAKDGREYQIADSGAPIRGTNGDIVGVVLVFRDVTEAYAQAQKIKESEKLLKSITANLPGVVFKFHAAGNGHYAFRYVSEKLTAYFGIESSLEDVFNAFHAGIPEKEKTEFMASIQRAADHVRPWRYEGRFIRPDGQSMWFAGSAMPQKEEDELIFYGVLTDITARKTAEKEALRLETALSQSQKMEAVGTLAGGIAHDFNNILSAVIGYAQLSLQEIRPDSRLYHNLEQILTAGLRARDLVSQILTFSRQQKRELIPLQVGPLVKESLKMLRATLPATIDIVHEIAADMDNVMADATQIHQIIMNLCTNAAQAMESNGGQLTVQATQVELSAAAADKWAELKPGPHIRLCIQDTGTGIAEDVIDNIFNPYFTTKETGKGTGLGLSVVHGIVKSFNGCIKASSQPGHGSTFEVYIPVIRRRSTLDEKEPVALPTGNERILFVDDEPFLTDIGKQTLEMLGYKVTACNSSLDALDAFKKAPDAIDLVISDVTMPKMTGDVLAARLLGIRKNLPIVLCTGFSDKISEEKAAEIGVKGFIMKPIIAEHLARLVRKALAT